MAIAETVSDPALLAVQAAEKNRITALTAGDIAAYANLLTPDFHVVHTDGSCGDKTTLLSRLNGDFHVLAVEWRNQRIAVHGDMALLSGDMFNRIEGRERGDIVVNPHRVLQVWRQTADGDWRLLAMHCTRFTPDHHKYRRETP